MSDHDTYIPHHLRVFDVTRPIMVLLVRILIVCLLLRTSTVASNGRANMFPALPHTRKAVAAPPAFSPYAVEKLKTLTVNAFDGENETSGIRPSRDLLNSNLLTKVDGNTNGYMFVHAVPRRPPLKNVIPRIQLPHLEQQRGRPIQEGTEETDFSATSTATSNINIRASENNRNENMKTTSIIDLADLEGRDDDALKRVDDRLIEEGVSLDGTTIVPQVHNFINHLEETDNSDMATISDLTKITDDFGEVDNHETEPLSNSRSTAHPHDSTSNYPGSSSEVQNQGSDANEGPNDAENVFETHTQQQGDNNLDTVKEVIDQVKESSEVESMDNQQRILTDSSANKKSVRLNGIQSTTEDDNQDEMVVSNEVLMKSFTSGKNALPFERDCRYNQSTGTIECVERTRNSCLLNTQRLQCTPENNSNMTGNIETCRKFKIINGRIYSLDQFPCRQIVLPRVDKDFRNQKANTREELPRQEQLESHSNMSLPLLENGWESGDGAKNTIAVEQKGTFANEKSTIAKEMVTVMDEGGTSGTEETIGKKTLRRKFQEWKPFHMNCGIERDDFAMKCRDWAVAGYCTTNNATKFLWCRKTCLCTGPPFE